MICLPFSQVDRLIPPLGYVKGVPGICPAPAMQSWMLMHFPCAGEAKSKAELMQRYKESESSTSED